MSITKSKFRLLLCIYVILIVIEILVIALAPSPVPDIVRELEGSGSALVAPGLELVLMLFVAALGFSGFIGLFLLWSLARYVYLTAVILRCLLAPVLWPWAIVTGWEGMLSQFELLADGLILTLSFTGPAKNLFKHR